MIGTLARRALQRVGFEVLVSDNGPDAIELFTQHRAMIDAVILDFTMPGMNGLEIMRAMREIDPHAQVILSSGHAESDATKQFADLGLKGFLKKPYGPEELLAAVHTVVG